MKKLLSLLAITLFAICLIGCGEEPTPGPVNPEPIDDPEPVEYTLTVDKTTVNLFVGEEETVVATVEPSDTLTWEAADPKVATVTNGKIKAIGKGETSVTVSTSDGKNKKTIKVTVEEFDAEECVKKALDALYKTEAKYRFSDSVNITIETKEGSIITVIYNKNGDALDELFFEEKGDMYIMVYIKDHVAYAMQDTMKLKTEVPPSEEKYIWYEYSAEVLLERATSFFYDDAIEKGLEFVSKNSDTYTFDVYQLTDQPTFAKGDIKLIVTYDGEYLSKVEYVYKSGPRVCISYNGFDRQTITAPSGLDEFEEYIEE